MTESKEGIPVNKNAKNVESNLNKIIDISVRIK